MTDKIAAIRARHEIDDRYRGWHPGAHKDRAALLAEVERLIRERDWARADVDQLRGDREKMLLDERDFVRKHRAEVERLIRERDEARAEVERLRDALSEAALLCCCDSAWSCEVVGSICSRALEAKP